MNEQVGMVSKLGTPQSQGLKDQFLDQALPDTFWGVPSLFLNKTKRDGTFPLAKTGYLYTSYRYTDLHSKYLPGNRVKFGEQLGNAMLTFQLLRVSGVTESLQAPG